MCFVSFCLYLASALAVVRSDSVSSADYSVSRTARSPALPRTDQTDWTPLDGLFDRNGDYLYVLSDEQSPRLLGYDISMWESLSSMEDVVSVTEGLDSRSKFIRRAGDSTLIVAGQELTFLDISNPHDVKITQTISNDADSLCPMFTTQDLAVVGEDLLFVVSDRTALVCSYKRSEVSGEWEVNDAVHGVIEICGGDWENSKRLAVDTDRNRLVVACSYMGFEVYDVDVEQGTLTSLGLSRFGDSVGDIGKLEVLGTDLYASVSAGFERFFIEPASGEVVQGEGALVLDGDNEVVQIADMVASADGSSIYVIQSGADPKILTFSRDTRSGGLQHRATSLIVDDDARRLLHNDAHDESLVVLSSKLASMSLGGSSGAPTAAPTATTSESPTFWLDGSLEKVKSVDDEELWLVVGAGVVSLLSFCVLLSCIRERSEALAPSVLAADALAKRCLVEPTVSGPITPAVAAADAPAKRGMEEVV